MYKVDITDKVKKIILFGLVSVLVPALIIGYAEFKYWHKSETLELYDAKVVGTMVSVRVLTNGKVKELLFEDGAEVKAGDVIARLEVAITEEEIKQLENTVQLARDKYAELQAGQVVKVAVQRERVTYPPAPPPAVVNSSPAPSSNLAKLEERANRMAELFDMGAVSAVQRDAARKAYESALAESRTQTTPTYESSSAAAPAPVIEHYTEYVDEFRPTPPEILEGAAQAIRQAELSLNIAKQEARETDVIAPVSGTIYYGVEVDNDLTAGDSIARIGDSRELWIEAEVTEEVFDKITLGKLASCTIDGKEFFGTVMEKIRPNVEEPAEETPVELPDIPTSENQPAPVIGDNPPAEDAQAPADAQQPAEAETPPAEETPQAVQAETEVIDGQAPADANQPAEGETPPADAQQPAEGETPPADAQQPAEGETPPQIPDATESQPKPNKKFIIKISLPVDRDFECRPNTEVVVKIKI